MAVYIHKEARVSYAHSNDVRESSDDQEGSTSSSASDGEMSDTIPLQDKTNVRKRGRRVLDYSESESDKENRGHFSKNGDFEDIPRRKRKQKRPVHLDLPTSQTSESALLLSELKETSKLIKKLNSKMNRHETRLQKLEDKLKEAASSSSSTPKHSTKREVPCEVKVSLVHSCIVEKGIA